MNGGGGGGTPGGSNTQIQYNNSNTFGGVPVLTYNGTTLIGTGSFNGSFIGPLTGTSSWSTNALTASYFSGNSLSASYALSASHSEISNKINVLDASTTASLFYPVIVDDAGQMVPYLDTSFSYTPSTNQLNVGGITSSLFGTASWSSNSVLAVNASTASYVNSLVQNVIITGSLDILNQNGASSLIIKSGSSSVLTVTGSGVTVLGIFPSPPISIAGGIYFDGTDFYLGY